MNTLNPETEDIQKTENKEDKLLEKAYKIAKGEISLEDLPEEEQLEFHTRFVVDKEEIPEPSDPNLMKAKGNRKKGQLKSQKPNLKKTKSFCRRGRRNTMN